MSDDDLITYQLGTAAFVKDRETGEVLAVELDERYSDWVWVFNADAGGLTGGARCLE